MNNKLFNKLNDKIADFLNDKVAAPNVITSGVFNKISEISRTFSLCPWCKVNNTSSTTTTKCCNKLINMCCVCKRKPQRECRICRSYRPYSTNFGAITWHNYDDGF